MKKVTVAVLTTSFPLYKGHPSGQYIYQLCLGLIRKEFQVKVLAPHSAEAEPREVLQGIEVKRFVYFLPKRWQKVAYGSGIPANLKRGLFPWFQLPFFFSSFLLHGIELVRQSHLVHCHWTFAGWIGVILKWVFKKPLIITVHGSDINLVLDRSFFRVLTTFVLKQADKVIAVSDDLRKKVVGFGIAPDKVKVIYHGVDPERFYPEEGSKRPGSNLLWIGRLAPEKGLSYLIKAMRRVITEFPTCRLRVVSAGDDDARKELLDLVAEEGVSEGVLVEGKRRSDELPLLMRQADILILPSLSESFGMVLIEAMASGVPVIASLVGGIPEVVEDRITGILVPPGDSTALSEAIIKLLKDPAKREEMGKRGRERVIRLFKWDTTIGATLKVYQDVLE